ncbi:electron transport complex protein RnfD [Litorivivens lipolytica]|uniref:Ion-translocating oxidoreductase complex subunit D n=1 Tax=Litorivivens lipolytica TaxID=1524264 RepID=A0A7W4Z765_9GAMM|nr:electron transport complex subunit RsxD [Litorivivens lipolytica]MBB3047720.1 electron transport complex protein RnfD [Litorivivens lipolytica]
MALITVSSPHAHGPMSTATVMRLVLLATLPGVFALTYFFGFGTLTNILFAALLALGMEAAILKIRKRPIGFYLNDGSALVTAILLGIALPPASPWWILAVGILFSIVFAKHLYGGMGYNPFNPAMVGYVVLLISFPVQMTSWVAPIGNFDGSVLGPIDALVRTFSASSVDAVTAATPLDVLKQNNSLLIEDLWASNSQFGSLAGVGWEWANVGFLLGGLFLLYKRVFTWHAPISMLIALTLLSAIFYDGGSSASGGSPMFHLFSGATMLGAFFIVTDPVTSAVSNKGRIIYGACIGVLIYLIRVWGNYPDAVAFSVLLMNFAAPLLDHYTQPRTYGHKKKTLQKETD